MPVLLLLRRICRAQTDFWFLLYRQHKLDESLAYQQFSANVGEEESWINEKNTLVGSDDYGDTLAAVQVSQLSHVMCGLPYIFQRLFSSKKTLIVSVFNNWYAWIGKITRSVLLKTKGACSPSQYLYLIRVCWRSMKRLKLIWRFTGRECRTLKMLETSSLKRWIPIHCLNKTWVELLLLITSPFPRERLDWYIYALYFCRW